MAIANNSFAEFMKGFIGDGSPLGDFADDALEDKEFPKEDDYGVIRRYLSKCSACIEACEAFESLWRAYRPEDFVSKDELTDAQRKSMAMFCDRLGCTERQALTMYNDIYGCIIEWNKGDKENEGVKLFNFFYANDPLRRIYHSEVVRLAVNDTELRVFTIEDVRVYPADFDETKRVRKEIGRLFDYKSWDYADVRHWEHD